MVRSSLLSLCALFGACDGAGSSAPQTAASQAVRAAKAASVTNRALELPQAAKHTHEGGTDDLKAPGIPQSAVNSSLLRSSYDECITSVAGVTPAMQDCLAAEYEYQDDRLNKAYRALTMQPAEKGTIKLRDEQRRWIVERDERCFHDRESGQAGRLEVNECRLRMTANRAIELESR